MKKYIKEITILIIQLIVFYLLPLTAGPTDAMGLVVLIILLTFILSIILSSISNTKYKYIYPILISILFIPSVFIYYNESALIHSLWYLIDSSIGMIIGSLIYYLINKKF
jgi:hypothetical protein